MNALELLKEDHNKVKQLFKQAESARDDKVRSQLFERIRNELELHAQIEEGVFYPACERIEGLRELIRQAYEDHQQVRSLLNEVEQGGGISSRLDGKLTLLRENVEQHVLEEEGELFPHVQKALNSRELAQLGEDLAHAKGQLETGRIRARI